MDNLIFLKVKSDDAVLYENGQIGKVITFIGGSGDSDAPTLFQIANVDSGEILSLSSQNQRREVCHFIL